MLTSTEFFDGLKTFINGAWKLLTKVEFQFADGLKINVFYLICLFFITGLALKVFSHLGLLDNVREGLSKKERKRDNGHNKHDRKS